jgi:SMI1-KNR4 cell-wall
MNVMHLAEKLIKQGCYPSSPLELQLIENLAGLNMPDNFHKLWLSVGGCSFVAKISSGKLQGEYVARFWNAQEILRKLEENNEIQADALAKVIPFADDFWGNTFFLADVDGIASRVLIADWNNQTVELVADCFDEFLGSLEVQ